MGSCLTFAWSGDPRRARVVAAVRAASRSAVGEVGLLLDTALELGAEIGFFPSPMICGLSLGKLFPLITACVARPRPLSDS